MAGGSSSQKQANRPLRSWETKESRYYCAVCNVWMGNDRQSILLHENGKKHKENVAKSLQDKRNERVQQDKQTAQQKGALAAMERAALQAIHTGTDSLYYDTSNLTPTLTTTAAADPYSGVPSYAGVPPPPPPSAPAVKPSSAPTKKDKKEKEEWNARKKQRKEKEEEGGDATTTTQSTSSKKKRVIAPDEGFYTITTNDDDNNNQTTTTYLEGIVYNEILEEEMPIQIWTGSNLASAEEKKLLHHQDLWMNGLVVAIRKRNATQQQDNNNNSKDEDHDKAVDVAYLKNPTDTEETLERGVLLHRIRIILGGDESIPGTLEEARILAMGGEEIHHASSDTAAAAVVDEATGFTGWSTVTVKRTTVHQEAREERAKQRQKERAAKKAAEEETKKAQLRKMEESKVQNAEDSALGAFDVWSQTQRGGYKGVDIHTEATVSVEDTAKKLSGGGEKVAFKKKSKLFNKAGKKRNRRTTSADDD